MATCITPVMRNFSVLLVIITVLSGCAKEDCVSDVVTDKDVEYIVIPSGNTTGIWSLLINDCETGDTSWLIVDQSTYNSTDIGESYR